MEIMTMAFAATDEKTLPFADINTTPLIDVMLVLLIMLIFTIPMATHSLDVDLPGPQQDSPAVPVDRIKNKVVLTAENQILWNGAAIDQRQLAAALEVATALPTEPELQFEPEAQASYNLSAHVLRTIKASGATKFGFVGNERYRSFDRQD